MPEADDAAAAVATYVKLLRAVRAVMGRVEPRLAAYGLTTTQLGVLEGVLHKGPMTHRELGRKVLTSAANMTDVIDKLAGRGLVVRVRSPQDRRQVRVELTACGRELIEDIYPKHAGDIARAMAGLGATELAQLADLLRTLGMAAARDAPDPSAAPDLAGCGVDDNLRCRSFDIEQSNAMQQETWHDPGGTV